jgi:hypothetical protein
MNRAQRGQPARNGDLDFTGLPHRSRGVRFARRSTPTPDRHDILRTDLVRELQTHDTCRAGPKSRCRTRHAPPRDASRHVITPTTGSAQTTTALLRRAASSPAGSAASNTTTRRSSPLPTSPAPTSPPSSTACSPSQTQPARARSRPPPHNVEGGGVGVDPGVTDWCPEVHGLSGDRAFGICAAGWFSA